MKTALLALLGSAIYATVRYNLLGGVPWSDWPVYILNKAFALASLVLLVVCVIRRCSSRGGSNVQALTMAGAFAAMHVVLSLALLSPIYYEKFFLQGRLTAGAGVSMLLGAAAAVAMAAGAARRAEPGTEAGAMTLAALAFAISLHVLPQGWAGWFAPQTWPGRMPPITLISFLLGLAAVGAAVWPRKTIV